MPQMTIYMDKETLKNIEHAAKMEHQSISQWVKNQLVKSLKSFWPENYFEVFGSLKDLKIERPPQPGFDNDVVREKL